MNTRIRQGLGLLVLTLIGWLIAAWLGQSGAEVVARIVAGPAVLAGFAGLGLIAYGLLRPART